MKTRIIYTKFWSDNYISNLTHKEKLAFLYFFTNEKVNICGIYELSDKYMKIDLDITQKELDRIKEKFMKDGKFIFIDGWVKIINFDLYNNFSGEKNETAKQKELSLIPEEIIQYIYPIEVLSTNNEEKYSIDRVSPNSDTLNNHIINNHNQKSIINNQNKGVVKGEEKIEYSDFVYMTETEYQKLIGKYGGTNTKAFIEKLSIWKGASGKTKAKGSDYLKILNWVVDAVLGKSENKKVNEPKSWQALRELKEEYDKEAVNDTS